MHRTVFQYFIAFYLHVCGSRRQIYGSISFLKRAQLPKANKVDLLRTFLSSVGEKNVELKELVRWDCAAHWCSEDNDGAPLWKLNVF